MYRCVHSWFSACMRFFFLALNTLFKIHTHTHAHTLLHTIFFNEWSGYTTIVGSPKQQQSNRRMIMMFINIWKKKKKKKKQQQQTKCEWTDEKSRACKKWIACSLGWCIQIVCEQKLNSRILKKFDALLIPFCGKYWNVDIKNTVSV